MPRTSPGERRRPPSRSAGISIAGLNAPSVLLLTHEFSLTLSQSWSPLLLVPVGGVAGERDRMGIYQWPVTNDARPIPGARVRVAVRAGASRREGNRSGPVSATG